MADFRIDRPRIDNSTAASIRRPAPSSDEATAGLITGLGEIAKKAYTDVKVDQLQAAAEQEVVDFVDRGKLVIAEASGTDPEPEVLTRYKERAERIKNAAKSATELQARLDKLTREEINSAPAFTRELMAARDRTLNLHQGDIKLVDAGLDDLVEQQQANSKKIYNEVVDFASKNNIPLIRNGANGPRQLTTDELYAAVMPVMAQMQTFAITDRNHDAQDRTNQTIWRNSELAGSIVTGYLNKINTQAQNILNDPNLDDNARITQLEMLEAQLTHEFTSKYGVGAKELPAYESALARFGPMFETYRQVAVGNISNQAAANRYSMVRNNMMYELFKDPEFAFLSLSSEVFADSEVLSTLVQDDVDIQAVRNLLRNVANGSSIGRRDPAPETTRTATQLMRHFAKREFPEEARPEMEQFLNDFVSEWRVMEDRESNDLYLDLLADPVVHKNLDLSPEAKQRAAYVTSTYLTEMLAPWANEFDSETMDLVVSGDGLYFQARSPESSEAVRTLNRRYASRMNKYIQIAGNISKQSSKEIALRMRNDVLEAYANRGPGFAESLMEALMSITYPEALSKRLYD